MKRELKIILVLIIAFLITQLTTKVFIGNSPQINRSLVSFNTVAKIGQSIIADFFTKKITPTPIPTPRHYIGSRDPEPPTPSRGVGTSPKPVLSIFPTKKLPTPTSKPSITQPITPTTIPSPTQTLSSSGCSTTSSQSYNSIGAERSSGDMPLNGDPANSPEINLHLRGFGPVNEGTNLISRNGSTYGLDDQMPPQISSLYGGPVPQIAKTYIVYGWDFQNSKSLAPEPATPNYKVTMLGLAASPGQKLLGLKAGRKIDAAGDVFMVLYATKNDIAFTHSPSDSLLGGYLFFFLDICVDPNLLAAYQKDNAGGRGQLPVVGQGQVFGYAGTSDVKVVVRDTMSFMDTRYKEDWWFYGQF